MTKVSIIIPARAEQEDNLRRTVDSVIGNATGEYEILIGFDGDPSYDFYYNSVKVIRFPEVVGIKTNINALAAMATGKYIYKSDAHCKFGYGFDEILQETMEEDWIVMPRFFVLNGENWYKQDERFYDYFYLSCPFTDPRGFRFKAGGHDPIKTEQRLESHPVTDETPQIHGSGWFMTKNRYFELGGFPNIDPYGHAQEPIWLALKNWLMGGKCMVNKKTWYAHLHQQGNKRGYHMDKEQENKSYKIAAEHFVGDKGHYLHNFEWFIEKFMPMPTWEDNWKEQLYAWRTNNG